MFALQNSKSDPQSNMFQLVNMRNARAHNIISGSDDITDDIRIRSKKSGLCNFHHSVI